MVMKYPFIRAWGYQLGSFQYYIDAEIERATRDKAPQRATYKSGTGQWRTVDDVTNPVTRKCLIDWVEAHKNDVIASEQ